MARMRIGLQMAIVFSVTVLGFVLLQHGIRVFETWASVSLTRLLAPHRATVVGGTSIIISPPHRPAFRAIVTPACSSAASVFSIVALATLIRGVSRGRRTLALATAVLVVMVGNVVRIGGSVLIGLLAGRASLVLFHDWVGGLFSFTSTLGGFIVMLYLILPDRRREASRSVKVSVG